jgi:PAS domain S-box-containing protein
LDNIIENSLDCIIVIDRRGTLIRVNRYFCTLLGYEVKDVLGKRMSEFTATEKGTYDLIAGVSIEITQEYIDQQLHMVTLLTEEKKIANWATYLLHKDGRLIPGEVNINYLYDEDGERTGSVAIIRDCTERKKAEKEITETRDFLDNVIENSLELVVIADPQGYIRRVNKIFLQSIGCTVEEIRGKHMSQCAPTAIGNYELVTGEVVTITPEFFDNQLDMVSMLRKEKKVSNWASFYCRKDGKLIPVEQNMFYLFNQKKEIIGAVGISRDVTERRKAEDKLRETTDFLDNIIENSLDCIVASDTKGYFTRVNKSFLTLLGYTQEEVLGRHSAEFAPPEEGIYEVITGQIVEIDGAYYKDQLAMMSSLLEEGKISNWEAYYCRKDKTLVPIEQNIVYLYNDKGEKTGTVGVLRNITWRKEAEAEILSTRDFLENVISTSLDGILVTDELSTITMINEAAVQILGYSREELLDHKIQGFLEFGGKAEERGKQVQKMLMEKGAVYGYEHVWKTKDGTFVNVEMSIALLKDKNKHLAGSVLSIRDVTERKQAEKKILDYQNQLRSMASQLTLTEEQERRSIATDLHDRIGQTLAISKIKLGALRVSTTSLGLDKDVDEIRDLVEQSIQDTRSLIFDLCPPFLYELGFEKALEWLLEDIQEQHGIITQLECDGKPYQLDDDLRILLYQSVRELFVNIVKHARAQHARLSVQKDSTTLNLCVEDDGRGFDEPSRAFRFDKKGGFGLFRIQERFHHLGGEITIDSKLHQGTRISLVLPVKSSEHPYKEDVQ